MNDHRCGECFWFDKKAGECHRFPPVPFPMPQMNALTGRPEAAILGLHAPTPEGGWCGEWKARVDA
jgi:hypothetical protein